MFFFSNIEVLWLLVQEWEQKELETKNILFEISVFCFEH